MLFLFFHLLLVGNRVSHTVVSIYFNYRNLHWKLYGCAKCSGVWYMIDGVVSLSGMPVERPASIVRLIVRRYC